MTHELETAKSGSSPPLDNKSRINYFPHLPAYSDPKTGLLSRLPSTWVPFAQLMRIDRPAGLYAFYFPFIIGLAYAACIAPAPPAPEAVMRTAAVLLPVNIVLRGIACTFNDMVDQGFDRQVERCRHRPIARGAVTTAQAQLFILAQFGIGHLILRFAGLPSACTPHLAVVAVLFCVYALMKRITYYPQVFLGIPFAWAVFICVAMLGMDPFRRDFAATSALFVANWLWTVVYDTIYAHQDVADDEKAGVKGMALRFKDSTKLLSSILLVAMLLSLVLSGVYAGFGSPYFIGTVGGVAVTMSYFIYDVDLKKPESCGAWFHDQFWIVGTGFLAGLVSEYIVKLLG